MLVISTPLRAATSDDDDKREFRHALLIGVDEFHALDLTNYVDSHPHSTLAQLSAMASPTITHLPGPVTFLGGSGGWYRAASLAQGRVAGASGLATLCCLPGMGILVGARCVLGTSGDVAGRS